MSQNKTIVPGVDFENGDMGYGYSDDFGSLYSRSANLDSKRTCIAGTPEVPVNESVPSVKNVCQQINDEKELRQVKVQNRVVVGVLFSISHGLLGELFPLYLGRNVIGRSEKCDVCLQEMTVSPEHAVLYVRKEDHDPLGMSITITDYNSMYGTTVNGCDGRYETLLVKENDIIVIGKHYKFVVKFFDTEKLNLSEENDFEESCDYKNAGFADANDRCGTIGSDFYSPTSVGHKSSRTVIG